MNQRGLLVLGVLAGVGMLAADASAFSVSYDQKTTHGRQVYQSKISMQDQLFRMDMTLDGQASSILRNAEGMFTVMPSQGMAMRMPRLQPGQGPIRGAENYAQYLQEQHAEPAGSETIDGKACDIYQFTDPEAGGTTKVWVWKEKMFPIRFETEGDGGKTVTELSNIQLGQAIPHETFQLPAGVQVMDMGALMGMGMR